MNVVNVVNNTWRKVGEEGGGLEPHGFNPPQVLETCLAPYAWHLPQFGGLAEAGGFEPPNGVIGTISRT